MGELSADRELLSHLALSAVNGLGPVILQRLHEAFGSARQILAASDDDLRTVRSVSGSLVSRIREASDLQQAAALLKTCTEQGIQILMRGRTGYPDCLDSIPDAPPVLYCRGTLQPTDQLAVAIVGSRRCTHYGRRIVERMAGGLARAGFTIVSGLARGIDGIAHREALKAGGRTIAVLANGVTDVYPPEHRQLADEVCEAGAVVSEFPPGLPPRSGQFPRRNRIISALSQGVIIIEATRTSGSLHTARHAMEQGREVFAVPGPVDSLASDGCHELIRDGVTLARNADDVIAGLGPLAKPAAVSSDTTIHNPRELTLNSLEKEVLNQIRTEPTSADEVVRALQMDPSRVLSTITVLEMRRFIRRLPGNMLVRT